MQNLKSPLAKKKYQSTIKYYFQEIIMKNKNTRKESKMAYYSI